jgi:3'-phosphoadenosine 5'-phosphosulfate sulfotransferase (PAPS reductase)/FAD synthetase
MTLNEWHKLNDDNLDLDEKSEIIKNMDEVDLYLLKLKQRFVSKIDPSKYYLSYSGGKDSHLLYWFIKEILQDDKIKIVGINTYMEFPEILKRIRQNSDIILYPKLKPMEIKEKYGIPCFSKEQDFYIYYYQNALRKGKTPSKTIYDKIHRQYKTGFHLSKKASEYVLGGNAHKITHLCCKYLKKEPAHRFEKESGLKPILGVMGSESSLRKSKYTTCLTSAGKFTPLWDCTDEIIDNIYKRYDIEIPEIYNHIKQSGCASCVYGSYKHDTEKELRLLSPAQRKFVCQYFKESYQVLGIDKYVDLETGELKE